MISSTLALQLYAALQYIMNLQKVKRSLGFVVNFLKHCFAILVLMRKGKRVQSTQAVIIAIKIAFCLGWNEVCVGLFGLSVVYIEKEGLE